MRAKGRVYDFSEVTGACRGICARSITSEFLPPRDVCSKEHCGWLVERCDEIERSVKNGGDPPDCFRLPTTNLANVYANGPLLATYNKGTSSAIVVQNAQPGLRFSSTMYIPASMASA